MVSAGGGVGFGAGVFAAGDDEGQVCHSGAGVFQYFMDGALQLPNGLFKFDRVFGQFNDGVAQIDDPLLGWRLKRHKGMVKVARQKGYRVLSPY